MPFGLCNAPGTFQHYMSNTFRNYLNNFLANFLDNLLIYLKTLKEHKEHVRKVFQRVQDAGLSLKLSKCKFHKKETTFLGYILSEHGISIDAAKVDSVLFWPTPQRTLNIQMFLGLANFYQRFIKGFSQLLVSITALLKKINTPFYWTNAADKAFNNLKTAFILSTNPMPLRLFQTSNRRNRRV
jgi:Reverse transcriptase (RNA-dependent DNA polymerase)